jgi:hypothetical protein
LNEDVARDMNISLESNAISKPLFHRFSSAQSVSYEDYNHVAKKGAEMAKLAGAVYQETIPTIHEIGHAFVANGTSADVAWMITDSIGYEDDFRNVPEGAESKPLLLRTITIRGFDASDENVDRERLVRRICNAASTPISSKLRDIEVHQGLLEVAREIYDDIKSFIDLAGPTHRIVLNGHSIGGALSNLILMIVAVERGTLFTQEKIKRVYTFGSPPIAKFKSGAGALKECSLLHALGLPSNMVYGYIEPWVSTYLSAGNAIINNDASLLLTTVPII